MMEDLPSGVRAKVRANKFHERGTIGILTKLMVWKKGGKVQETLNTITVGRSISYINNF